MFNYCNKRCLKYSECQSFRGESYFLITYNYIEIKYIFTLYKHYLTKTFPDKQRVIFSNNKEDIFQSWSLL